MAIDIAPLDEHNEQLLHEVHPPGWENPRPNRPYHLVAIGGGPAGLVAASLAAGLGARVALVERGLLGGDCLNYGCVPSKSLVRAARVAHEIAAAEHYGQRVAGHEIDFPGIMQRMREQRTRIGRHDAAERLRAHGIDVYFGQATFTGNSALEVGGQELRFRRAVIATGSRPIVPPIEGLAEVGVLTNETLFSLTALPRRLVVLGAGAIGCEMGQCFRRFGSEVHLIDLHDRLLGREDPKASTLLARQFQREGIHLHLGWTVVRAEPTGGSKSVVLERGGEKKKLLADAILAAVGRQPNVAGLGLEKAGVGQTAAGVTVNDRLQTTNRRIFAAGDVCSRFQFTHAADAMARLVVQNALFFRRQKASSLVIPRTTYTDPEVAHVGLTPDEAARENLQIDSYRVDLSEIDRAILDGEEEGFAVVHTRRGSGRVVGATIVAAHAGEMIAEVALLMTRKLGLKHLSGVIHCYPTQAEVLKRAADNYQRTRLTPRLARLLKAWFQW